MAEKGEEKKSKKFRIKWWWDSDDEEKAKENPTYAEGLEKTEDVIKNKDMTKDEIREKKEEILGKTLGDADQSDKQKTQGTLDNQNGGRHGQASENHNTAQSKEGTRGFDSSGPSNARASNVDHSNPSTGDMEHGGKTAPERNPNANEEGQDGSDGHGTRASEDNHENTNADKSQQSSFFDWFGGKSNDDSAGDKKSFATQDSNNKSRDGLQAEGENRATEGEDPSHIRWVGKNNAQGDSRETPNGNIENSHSTGTRPFADNNAKMGNSAASGLDANKDPSTSKENANASYDTGNKEQDQNRNDNNGGIASWFGFDGGNSSNDNDKVSSSQQDGNGDIPTGDGSNNIQKNSEYPQQGAEGTLENDKSAPTRDAAGQETNEHPQQGTEGALERDKSAQETANYGAAILFCGYINLCLALIFLFYTEILRDCTIMFNTVPLICLLLAANLPFLLFVISRGKVSYAFAIVSIIATILLIVYLYNHRVRVYFYQISIDNATSDRLLRIQDQKWSERTPSVLRLLSDNEIYLEDWVRNSKKPGAKVFILKHELEFNDDQYLYLNSVAKKSLKEQVKRLPPYENGAIITFPMIKYSWSEKRALEILKEMASMRFSNIGENYALIIGIYPSTFNYSEIFGTEPVNIGRIDTRSVMSGFDPMEENPKV